MGDLSSYGAIYWSQSKAFIYFILFFQRKNPFLQLKRGGRVLSTYSKDR